MIFSHLSILRKRFRSLITPEFLPPRTMRSLTAVVLLALVPGVLPAQELPVAVSVQPPDHRVVVTAGGQPFTTFLYPDSLEKPVLYPIYAPDGQLITRGFPVSPRPGEPVDHPHHLGLWFNYEKVNGLDFWNNSYAIPAAKKSQYGWIHTDEILDPSTGKSTGPSRKSRASNQLTYKARWTDQQGHVLLNELTTFIFSATKDERIIDRITTLTAVADGGVSFPDAKDGMLGLRVTKELQIPSKTPGEFIDDKGNITKVAAGNTPDINGNYLTS